VALRIAPEAGAARRRQGEGRPLVPGRVRCQRRGRAPLQRAVLEAGGRAARGPGEPPPAFLLRADRTVRGGWTRSRALEGGPGSAAGRGPRDPGYGDGGLDR